MASRYGWTLSYIESMSIMEIVPLIRMASQKEQDKQIREQWLMLLPIMQMNMIKYISFEDYKVKVSGGDIDNRPAEEIIAEVAEIRKTMGVNNGSV